MDVIRPWNKEAERILRQLARYGRTYTTDPKLPRVFGRKYQSIIDADLIDISRSDKKRRTWFVLPPDVGLAPIGIFDSRSERRPLFRFFRL